VNHVLRKLVHHYEERGVRGLLRKLVGYLRHRAWSETLWVVYEHALIGDTDRVAESVARRDLGFRELVSVGYFKVKAFPEEIRRRFEDRTVCHGFYLGDRLATIGWSSADYLELDSNVHFPCPGAVGLFDFYTFEEFRSRGFYTSALMQLADVMRDKGFARAYIAVDPGNLSSLKGIERAGFRPVLRITRRWRFGVSIISHWQSIGENAPGGESETQALD